VWQQLRHWDLPDRQRHDEVLSAGTDELQRHVRRSASRRSALRLVHDGVRRNRYVLHRHVQRHAERRSELRHVWNHVHERRQLLVGHAGDVLWHRRIELQRIVQHAR
jgi:hypothetical protein